MYKSKCEIDANQYKTKIGVVFGQIRDEIKDDWQRSNYLGIGVKLTLSLPMSLLAYYKFNEFFEEVKK